MKRFSLGFILGLSLVACGSIPIFPYDFYHISGNNFGGTLLGPKQDGSKDIPFSRCAPVNGKQQCVVVFYTELGELIKDYKKTKSDLIACEKGNK